MTKIPVNKGFTDVKIGDALCSSHFDSESFKNVTSDTNQTRNRNEQSGETGEDKENARSLIRTCLKSNAVPTIWPNCPAY